jgi:hypothetical protein
VLFRSQIRGGVNDVASAAERMAARSVALSNLSDNLENILGFFKLGEDNIVTDTLPVRQLPSPAAGRRSRGDR